MLRKAMNMGQALRARAVEGSPWASESPRSQAVVTLVRVTESQEREGMTWRSVNESYQEE